MNFFERALDFVFPPICGFCGKRNGKYICEDCNRIIRVIAQNHIDTYKNKYFNKHLYIFKYEEIIREKIIKYKFENESFLYRTFLEAVLENKENIKFIQNYELLIPVPIHKKRKKQRGYNQSELIARAISYKLKKIKLDTHILIKNKNIKPQSNLNRREREVNIKGVYSLVESDKIKNKKILILDDIFTTGSTVNECSKVLKCAGAKEIGIITLAKD